MLEHGKNQIADWIKNHGMEALKLAGTALFADGDDSEAARDYSALEWASDLMFNDPDASETAFTDVNFEMEDERDLSTLDWIGALDFDVLLATPPGETPEPYQESAKPLHTIAKRKRPNRATNATPKKLEFPADAEMNQ